MHSNFTVYDPDDSLGGNIGAFTFEDVEFFADYINRSSGETIASADCNITFSDGVSGNLSFVSSSEPYEFARTFESIGDYSWGVSCNVSDFTDMFSGEIISVNNPLKQSFGQVRLDLLPLLWLTVM